MMQSPAHPDETVGRVLLVFLDGVGLGVTDPAVNPLAAARLPTFARLLHGHIPAAATAPLHTDLASLIGLDALLGVPGLPQSGTGQATLLTGTNAARAFGRHYGPWTPTALRSLVADHSLLAVAQRAGRRVAFANAYPEEVFEPAATPRARGPLRAGPPIAALGAGLLTRHTAALTTGDAVASEITNEGWRHRLGRLELPVITPQQAGANLARIATAHDLTFFAHYTTDTVGHRGTPHEAIAAIEQVDAFLDGILTNLPADVLLVVTSDHGNLEDTRTGHTTNPALTLVAGPSHTHFTHALHTLTDITPAILERLGLSHP